MGSICTTCGGSGCSPNGDGKCGVCEGMGYHVVVRLKVHKHGEKCIKCGTIVPSVTQWYAKNMMCDDDYNRFLLWLKAELKEGKITVNQARKALNMPTLDDFGVKE